MTILSMLGAEGDSTNGKINYKYGCRSIEVRGDCWQVQGYGYVYDYGYELGGWQGNSARGSRVQVLQHC